MLKRGLSGILAVLTGASPAGAVTLRGYMQNHEGLKQLENKSYFQAYQAFLKALEENPLEPRLQLNLALTFEANEEYEKAEAAYKGVLKLTDQASPLHFEALFNLGGVLGKEGKIDEALSAYQQALEIDPENKDVKTNIELLWQGGGGQGQGKDQDKDKNDKNDKNQGQGQNKDKNKDSKDDQDQKQKKPRPFQSQELTPEDVKKILDEIKNQEQSVRAQEYEHKAKQAPLGKDW